MDPLPYFSLLLHFSWNSCYQIFLDTLWILNIFSHGSLELFLRANFIRKIVIFDFLKKTVEDNWTSKVFFTNEQTDGWTHRHVRWNSYLDCNKNQRIKQSCFEIRYLQYGINFNQTIMIVLIILLVTEVVADNNRLRGGCPAKETEAPWVVYIKREK